MNLSKVAISKACELIVELIHENEGIIGKAFISLGGKIDLNAKISLAYINEEEIDINVNLIHDTMGKNKSHKREVLNYNQLNIFDENEPSSTATVIQDYKK